MLRMHTQSLRPVEQLRSDMDCIIQDVFGTRNKSFPEVRGARGNPPIDVWEENDDFFVALDVPGATGGEVDITALGRELTVESSRSATGQQDAAGEETKGTENSEENQGPVYHHRERLSGTFHRMIRFPFDIDVENVEGSLSAGVLTVRVPKAASAKPRRIEIGAK
ncbi:MAG TPA: Hsp20/alpha crystallin family protein [Pirellulales bacterium]|jgi:HSP20 family protein|nr:Hsp20/alpha crystallin family protein [Pirellulales bacterium]